MEMVFYSELFPIILNNTEFQLMLQTLRQGKIGSEWTIQDLN